MAVVAIVPRETLGYGLQRSGGARREHNAVLLGVRVEVFEDPATETCAFFMLSYTRTGTRQPVAAVFDVAPVNFMRFANEYGI
jgi:hypothetical protein